MLVLASASPRRAEILRNAGVPFTVLASDAEEKIGSGESPRACAERLAQAKAVAVHKTRPGDYVLGADTLVIVNGEILGKPKDAEDAARMLRLLSGRSHQVITGVCLITPRGVQDITSEGTLVMMTEIGATEIEEYVRSEEPMDKAGAYAIQGRASRYVTRIEGDYSNVVGLPMAVVYRLLKLRGFQF